MLTTKRPSKRPRWRWRLDWMFPGLRATDMMPLSPYLRASSLEKTTLPYGSSTQNECSKHQFRSTDQFTLHVEHLGPFLLAFRAILESIQIDCVGEFCTWRCRVYDPCFAIWTWFRCCEKLGKQEGGEIKMTWCRKRIRVYLGAQTQLNSIKETYQACLFRIADHILEQWQVQQEGPLHP